MTAPTERLTPRAHQVMALAHAEAQRYHRPHVAAEHILLALLDAPDTTASRLLRHFNIDSARVRAAVESLTQHHTINDGAPTTLSPRALRILALASDEAQHHLHAELGTGHLLIALVRENEGIPAGVLALMGLHIRNLEPLRQQLLATDGPPLV